MYALCPGEGPLLEQPETHEVGHTLQAHPQSTNSPPPLHPMPWPLPPTSSDVSLEEDRNLVPRLALASSYTA